MHIQKVNILLVDDLPQNLIALEAVLKNPEYNLICASSGEEALKHVLQYDFAVILLDVQMPGLSGFETAKLVKSREKSKDIPIVFVTAINKASEHVWQGYSEGAIDYIFKPFDPKTLRLKIRTFVEMYRSRRQLEIHSRLLEQRAQELEEANSKLKVITADLARAEDERKRQYELLEKLVDERTRELGLSEERFRRIFESSPSLISIRSLKDGKIIDVNQYLLNLTGYTLDEIKNGSHSILLPLDDVESDINKLKNIKVKYYTKQGKLRYGLMSTEKIVLEGEECALDVVTDITERIMMDRELTRLDRLYLIGEMAAGIAHEIRNPMTTVHGFLQTLEGKTLSSDYVDLMLDELKRANSIITEFLSLAKNKKSDRKLQDLNSIISHLLPLIEAEGLRQDKYMIVDLNECPVLNLDEKEIRQLILNLTLNGLEAMQEGGTLKIRTYVDDNEVVLEISDQGCGIREDIADKIGTPFFTTKSTGTGLGLAVCYSVAARHNATVNFKTGSTGTIFFVRFKSKTLKLKHDNLPNNTTQAI